MCFFFFFSFSFISLIADGPVGGGYVALTLFNASSSMPTMFEYIDYTMPGGESLS